MHFLGPAVELANEQKTEAAVLHYLLYSLCGLGWEDHDLGAAK